MKIRIDFEVDIPDNQYVWWLFDVKHESPKAQLLSRVAEKATQEYITSINHFHSLKEEYEKGIHPASQKASESAR